MWNMEIPLKEQTLNQRRGYKKSNYSVIMRLNSPSKQKVEGQTPGLAEACLTAALQRVSNQTDSAGPAPAADHRGQFCR